MNSQEIYNAFEAEKIRLQMEVIDDLRSESETGKGLKELMNLLYKFRYERNIERDAAFTKHLFLISKILLTMKNELTDAQYGEIHRRINNIKAVDVFD